MRKRDTLWARLTLGQPRTLLLALVMMIAGIAFPRAASAQDNPLRPAPTAVDAASPAPAHLAPAEVSKANVEIQKPHAGGGEANLEIPDLNSATFFNGAVGGHTLLMYGLIVCALGVVFGLVVYVRLKNMAVHPRCWKCRS